MEELFIRDNEGIHITGLPRMASRSWKVSRKIVRAAIKFARNSMPGPDGIPAAAYKALHDIAADIFFDSISALSSAEGPSFLVAAYADRCGAGKHDFNLSLLCCLPKKPVGTDPDHGDYYSGENTRPLALVNVDNRIIASAARFAWEPLVDNYISHMQKRLC